MSTDEKVKEINDESWYLFILELNSMEWHIGILGHVGVEGVSLWKPVQEKKKLKATFLAPQGRRRDTCEKLRGSVTHTYVQE